MRSSSSKWTEINGKYGKWPAEPIGGEVPEQEKELASSFSPQILIELEQPGEPVERMPPLKDSRLMLIFVHLRLEPLVDRAITWVTPAQPPAQPGAQLEAPEQVKQLGQLVATPFAQLRVVKPDADTERLERLERVHSALRDKPDAGYNELGRLTGLAAATAQKYRQQIEQEQVS